MDNKQQVVWQGSRRLTDGICAQQQFELRFDSGGINIQDPNVQDPPALYLRIGDKLCQIKVEDLIRQQCHN